MIRERKGQLLKDREISWLNFNQRVLQEAADTSNPLLERVRFLAIFSNNLDEFFRVRVAQLQRLQRINGKKPVSEFQGSPDEILHEIQRTVLQLQNKFNDIYQNQVIPELGKAGIYLVEEKDLRPEEAVVVNAYFKNTVLNHLFPIILDDLRHIPHLRDRSIYLAVKMRGSQTMQPPRHALIEIPVPVVSRFFVLPSNENGDTRIILLEDIIRFNLNRIFSIFDYSVFEGFIIKITRDAEFEINVDDEVFSVSLLDRIQKSLKQRSKGLPTRFVYDSSMPRDMLDLIVRRLQLKTTNLIPGGRNHNFKDFMDFPGLGKPELYFQPITAVPVNELEQTQRMFDLISRRDVLLHHPYHSFDYLIRFLREAAIDPDVISIQITLYRLARNSNVVNALINAVKNGKKVMVLMELQARFDEEANIHWTNQLQEAGAQVHFGKAGQKVHCKMCLITRKEGAQVARYAHLSTGNYNGSTAKIYSDVALFTKDAGITADLEALSDLLFRNLKRTGYKHLLVAPDFMKNQWLKLIDEEIAHAKKGHPAFIDGKMNALVDYDVIRKLYDASNAGVKIRLIIRGICCLVPGMRGFSENIEVISIVDRNLEHTRLFIFGNKGEPRYYLSSADWMTRNLTRRIEIAFPVYAEPNKEFLRKMFDMQWNDPRKARKIDGVADHLYARKDPGLTSQEAMFEYLKKVSAR